MIYDLRRENEERVIPFIWINEKEHSEEVQVKLIGDGSRAHIVGIFLGSKNSSITFNTNVVHRGRNTYSRTDIRAVFLDHSSFNNDGMIHIAKGAKGADGYFTSKVLLFDDAKGRSVPSLEIDENELKAGHASTIGRPDEAHILYMRSRGIPQKDAEKLIVAGFFDSVLRLLSIKEQEKVRKQIQAVL